MFFKRPAFKSGLASLLLSVCAFVPAAAHADESQEQLVAAMLNASPFACIASANGMLNDQMSLMAPGAILKGMANRLGKDATWGKGDKVYDELYAIVSVALEVDIAKNGPIMDVPARRLFDATASQLNPDERRQFTQFFASPAGKLYLTDIVDGAICTGWLQSLNKAPYPPFVGPAKAKWETLLQSKIQVRENLPAKLAALSPKNLRELEASAGKLSDAFGQALGMIAKEAPPAARFQAALEPSLPEIARVLRAEK